MNNLAKTLVGVSLLAASGLTYAAGDAKHYPGVFLGATNFDSETDFTFGIEYEYKFDKKFGVGAVWERTIEGHDGDGVNVIVGSLLYHPSEQWRLGIGFGEEQIRGKKPKDKEDNKASTASLSQTPPDSKQEASPLKALIDRERMIDELVEEILPVVANRLRVRIRKLIEENKL